MEHRSLSFKYWIEFDADGDIKALHKNKYNCELLCKEYVVKLIPIKRDVGKDISEGVDKFTRELTKRSKILDTEFKKAIKTVRRVLK